MNDQGSPCFFVVKAREEAAQVVAAELSQSASSDIIEATLVSADFQYDIGVLLGMDAVIKHTAAGLHETTVTEQFNPLFLPQLLPELDDMLELQMKSDSVRFTGMDGSPFTIKMTGVKHDEETLIVGKAQYHPFDLPTYPEIVETHEHTRFN